MACTPRTLNKSVLAELISNRLQCPLAEGKAAVEIILTMLEDCLQRGEKIKITGFGSFAVRAKKARVAHDFRNGMPLVLAARHVISFKPSDRLRKAVGRDHTKRKWKKNTFDGRSLLTKTINEIRDA